MRGNTDLNLDYITVRVGVSKVKLYCSESIFAKSASFEVRESILISTQIYGAKNRIEGEFRAARFHDQTITWGVAVEDEDVAVAFDVASLQVSCTCTYFKKMANTTGSKCCSHIIGQMRRAIF